MLIGIDGNEANIKNRVGVGQYAFNLLHNLYKIDKSNRYIIYLKNSPATDLPVPKTNWQYRIFGPQKLWTKIALPLKLFEQKEKLDLFFSPSHYSPHFSPFPTIPTIHDLGYLKFSDQFTKKDLYQLTNWTKRSINKASHIITVSNFSKQEIQSTYNIDSEKISIAPNGVSKPPVISDKKTSQTLNKFKITKPYFLYLGTLKPNKNIPFLIKAFARFIKKDDQNSKYTLVIAGKKGWLFDEIFNTVQKEKLTDKVVFTDYINESEKWILYQNTVSLVMPSLYEGFGIPVLEALRVGTPVIASNIPPLKEVVNESGLLINPKNINDLLEKMAYITKPSNNNKFKKAGPIKAKEYSWENTAKSVLKVFEKVHGF